MELDELKQQWAEHDQKLETSLRLNRQLLKVVYMRRARFALVRLAAILGLGSIMMLAAIVWLGAFISQNLAMPRFALPAVVLDIFAIGGLAAVMAQIALALRIDYGRPVAVIQRRLEKLRRLRIRYVQAIFLVATFAWMPMFIVAMKAFFGVDVYRDFDRGWLVSNLAIGAAIIPLGIWLAKKYGDRMNRSAFGRRIMNDIAGYNLNAADDFIATLARFEEEEPE